MCLGFGWANHRQPLVHTPDPRSCESRGRLDLTVSTFVRLAVTSSLFITRLAWLFIDPTALLGASVACIFLPRCLLSRLWVSSRTTCTQTTGNASVECLTARITQPTHLPRISVVSSRESRAIGLRGQLISGVITFACAQSTTVWGDLLSHVVVLLSSFVLH